MALRQKDEKATMKRRLREATGIANQVEAHLKAAPQTDVLVMGDLNTNHTSPYGPPVLEAVSLANHPDPAFRLQELMLKDGRPEPTHDGHEKFPDSKMDYMYASPGLVARVRDTHVVGALRQNPWRQASDHLALVTEIEVPDPPVATSASGVSAPTFGRALDRVA